MITAAIGIGSNSVRMLLADIRGDQGKRLLRDREGTRLFAGLDGDNRLSEASMQSTVQAVARMAADARARGAEIISLFATSAVRDASNADRLAELLREAAGVELEICSGTEEASLSFLGATDGEFSGVIDIGGGSTEIVIGQGMRLDTAFSCQMGAVRLFRKAAISSREDIPPVRDMALAILEDKLKENPVPRLPEKWIGVGGTFTTLAAMALGIPWTERTYMHGTRVTRAQTEELARRLADMPLEERLKLPGLQPNRADIVVHGICILMACMDRLEIPAVTISEYGNLDGYMKRKFGLKGEIRA